MLETWFEKVQQGIAGHGRKPFQWMHVFPPGVWIVICVLGLLGGRMLWVNASRPAHRQEIAAALGSASLFYGSPQLNHDGSRFTYVATSDIGYGLFLFDNATGHKKMIFDEHGVGRFGGSLDLYAWPWSPDDSAFIYSVHDQLIVFPIDTKDASLQLTVGTNAITGVAWLNPDEFAYASWDTNLCVVKKQNDGHWEQHELLHGNRISSLTAVETNAIAWLQDGLICRLNLTPGLSGISNMLASLVIDTNLLLPTNGLKLWLDASILQQTDQSVVPVLTDLSPSKNDAVQSENPPIFNASESSGALNGRGTIHFTSADTTGKATGLRTRDNLGITNNTPRTVFVVMHHDAGKVMRINIGDFSARFGFFGLEEDERSIYLPRIWKNLANRINVKSSGWNISEAIYDGKIEKAYVNGVFKGTNNIQVKTVDGKVEIGLRSGGIIGTNVTTLNVGFEKLTIDNRTIEAGDTGSDGDFAELMIYNRALDTGERQMVENYLKYKWIGNNLLSPQSPLVWCDPQTEGITGFSYSKKAGQFLLNCTENGRDSLWRYDPKSAQTLQIAEATSIKSAQWVGDNECAYASLEPGHNGVMVTDSSGQEEDHLFGHESIINWFNIASDGGKLLILGAISNEPTMEIWKYDRESKQLSSIVSYSDYPSVHAKNIVPFDGTIKLSSGRSVNCTIYPPSNFDRRKKYPLVLGDTVFHTIINGSDGRLGMPAIAMCGAYVVIVDRESWGGGIEKWGDNVMDAYKSLARDPCIDAKQVYLFAASAETQYMSDLISSTPGLWKGAIFLNPAGLPDFSKSPPFQSRPKILISAGSEEGEDDRLKHFQEDALKSGVMVDYVISSCEGHHFTGNTAQLERTKAMMHFIFEE
jgi:hypothetical protein